MQEVMQHELSTYPPALFEARHIFREADKPQIATAITEHASSVTSGEYEVVKESVSKTDHYVLDGGSLMEGPCCIECHGKLETVMGPWIWCAWIWLSVYQRQYPSKTRHERPPGCSLYCRH